MLWSRKLFLWRINTCFIALKFTINFFKISIGFFFSLLLSIHFDIKHVFLSLLQVPDTPSCIGPSGECGSCHIDPITGRALWLPQSSVLPSHKALRLVLHVAQPPAKLRPETVLYTRNCVPTVSISTILSNCYKYTHTGSPREILLKWSKKFWNPEIVFAYKVMMLY